MSRGSMSRVKHGPFCSDDELYFAYKARDYDYPMRVNGKLIGHLLPSNVTRPYTERFRGGGETPEFWSEGGTPGFEGYRPNYLDLTSGCSSFGVARTPRYFDDDMFLNPYDPVNLCSSSRWCPGSGLSLPCCTNADKMLSGNFRLRSCPRGLCREFY